MRTVCVDDDLGALQSTLSLCGDSPAITALAGFSDPEAALRYIKEHPAELVILDIHMPKMDGIALAEAIREIRPDTAIVFLTARPEFALEAWKLHASGYVLKPLTSRRLTEELRSAARWRRKHSPGEAKSGVEVRTFGSFDLFVDDRRVIFERSKAKELLACLVDRKGSRITRKELFIGCGVRKSIPDPGRKPWMWSSAAFAALFGKTESSRS